MASKSDRFYYDNIIGATDCCRRAAKYLEECLKTYDHSRIDEMLVQMHAIEHEADTRKHAMVEALARAFVTPIDREDLAEISQDIDNVADAIEEVLQQLYVNETKTIMPEAIGFAGEIVRCCELLCQLAAELSNFKKSQRLKELIVEINGCEAHCDQLYLEAKLRVRQYSTDVLEILFWRDLYDHFEDCADACEHVGDCVGTVIMKNT